MTTTDLKRLTLFSGVALIALLFTHRVEATRAGVDARIWVVSAKLDSTHPAPLRDKTAPSQDKPAQPQTKNAEETYKNIQIFKGLPAQGVMRAMTFFTTSLGVDCTHCHVPGEFEKDDKPAKLTARKMYQMVQLSNKALASNRVSCYGCHRGHVQPEPVPDSLKTELDEMGKKGAEDQRPAEQVYKNIQTLKGVPAGRWMMLMTMFSKSLGVDCTHCHVQGEFEKDDKPAKQTARKMLSMVGSIAREIYKGSTSINCYTCHKGKAQPVSFPPASAQPAPGAKPAETKPPETKPPETNPQR